MASSSSLTSVIPASSLGNKMGMCMICDLSQGKYRCPECEMVTCSLDCSTKHKKEYNCSGIRSKTEFIPIKEMNEFHLLSDYRLLEELSRVTDSCSRDTLKKSTRKEAPLPPPLVKLRKAAFHRNCKLYFLPKTFARHQENTTMFDWKQKKIFWRLKLVFLHAKKFVFPVTRCPEDVNLETVVEKCLNEAMLRKKELKKHFEAFSKAQADIEILLQAEKVPGASQKMFVLENGKTLRENLEGKIIVEFPVLYVALKGFYKAENLSDITKEKKGKSKLNSLLISDYSLREGASVTEKKMKEPSESASSGESDNEDVDFNEDEAFDCLDSSSNVKDVLNSLYVQAGQK